MERLWWVCLGGALGSGARYLVAGWAFRVLGPGFPWGTLAVNVVGSFAVGLLMHVGLTTGLLSPTVRVALTTGVMGGFTTYSTFSYETVVYLQGGAWVLGTLNVAATVVGCIVACFLGLTAGRLLVGA
jgi:fluoride exporter